jgi:hypothetical protein
MNKKNFKKGQTKKEYNSTSLLLSEEVEGS